MFTVFVVIFKGYFHVFGGGELVTRLQVTEVSVESAAENMGYIIIIGPGTAGPYVGYYAHLNWGLVHIMWPISQLNPVKWIHALTY